MLLWVSLILLLNGIISFAYVAINSADPTTLWAMLALNFFFYVGISQAGIIFSAYMKIAKSEWGVYFSRLGEILTLAFLPVAVIIFTIIYFGGSEHLFWWAAHNSSDEAAKGHLSPWLNKSFFLWRTIVTWGIFYALSYLYFRTGRLSEKGDATTFDLEKRLNVLASFVMVSFVIAESNLAWDFGMMIIPHWESTIFPAYVWVGNIFAGAAFLFLLSRLFIDSKRLDREHLDSKGKLLLGFTILWIYMFWSQHIVTWYGDLPNIIDPLNKQMGGNYTSVFLVMLVMLFIMPFFALIQKVIKFSAAGLSIVAAIICAGMWLNRYLLIMPVFSDGSEWIVVSWAGISLILAGLAATVLSVLLFFKLFPQVTTIQKMSK